MDILKQIFAGSKWLHKYIGLFIILFLLWSALSGIILNHPKLVSGVNVPGWLVTPQYKTKNWNRSSLVDFLFLKKNSDIGFIGGKKGVWKTFDGGRTFSRMSDGYTNSLYYGKVNDLYLMEGENTRLFAASFGGLWMCDPFEGKWEKIFSLKEKREIKKIIRIDNRLVIFTDSFAFEADIQNFPLSFTKKELKRDGEEKAKKVSLVRLFFDLHGGHIWGLAGRLLFDLFGLLIIFLSVSSFYMWYFPKRRKRKKRNGRQSGLFSFFHKYHLKLGIWLAFFLLIIGVTAFFMRPPFLAVIARSNIDVSMYPGHYPDNPWDRKIHNAMYLKKQGKVLIETEDGVWEGDPQLDGKFRKTRIPVPVFIMGATVFEPYPEGGFLVGSFNGLFHISGDGRAVDMVSGKPAGFVSPVRPSKKMVAGYFTGPEGGEFIAAFEQGIIPLKGAELNGRFRTPDELENDKRLPLWNYMFELHNGRIFKDLIGNWYILIIPLVSFLFILITLTGIYDWIYTRLKDRKKS